MVSTISNGEQVSQGSQGICEQQVHRARPEWEDMKANAHAAHACPRVEGAQTTSRARASSAHSLVTREPSLAGDGRAQALVGLSHSSSFGGGR
eukprot:5009148-Prymnesium_polylepis.1